MAMFSLDEIKDLDQVRLWELFYHKHAQKIIFNFENVQKSVIPLGLKISTSSISRKDWSAYENQNMFESKCSFWNWMCGEAINKVFGCKWVGAKRGLISA